MRFYFLQIHSCARLFSSNGCPLAVFRAILDEAAGVTHWWMPHWESRLRGETSIDGVGVVFDITIRGRGTPRFSGKIARIVEGRLGGG